MKIAAGIEAEAMPPTGEGRALPLTRGAEITSSGSTRFGGGFDATGSLAGGAGGTTGCSGGAGVSAGGGGGGAGSFAGGEYSVMPWKGL